MTAYRKVPSKCVLHFISDGPRGSLLRLRSQLAEDDDCEYSELSDDEIESEECVSSSDSSSNLEMNKEENERLGVYWLIKASEQGNTEATNILKQCLETGQGQDFITTDQLQRRMQLVDKSVSRRTEAPQITLKKSDSKQTDEDGSSGGGDDENWNARGEYSGEKLTEDHLVSAAAMYARGELPIVHQILSLTTPQLRAIDATNFFQHFVLHPLMTLKSLYVKVIETLAKRSAPFMSSLFPTALSHVQTIILLFLYSIFGTESLILFIPMALYYVSFCVMVVSTFQMLYRKCEFSDFRVWSQLFLSYSGGSLNPEEAEYQYCRNKLRPYGNFFLALLINLVVYPLIAPQWTPQSEFTILAFFLTMLTLYAFMDDKRAPDFLALFSFAVHVLAKYPYETDAVVRQGWRFLDIRIPTFASYVVGNGVEFCLNFRAVFYLLIPAVFAKIAARDNWRGTYKTLIPHCVTLAWWQMAVISSQGATWYGLIRSTLALVGLVLFLPLAGLATILLPVAAVGKYLADSAVFIRVSVSILLASIPVSLTWYLGCRRARGMTGGFIDKFISKIQVLLGIIAALSLLLPAMHNITQHTDTVVDYSDGGGGSLTWEQYQNFCHQPAWEQSSLALVQLQCSHLVGLPVGWDGYVTDVRIQSISNTLQTIFSRYKFEVRVKMKSGMWGKGAEVTLIAEDSFRNFTLALRPGDRVWFSGYLMSGGSSEGRDASDNLLGGLKPQVDLEEIGCLGCHRSELQIHKKSPGSLKSISNTSIIAYGYAGLKSVLNFIFNPLVIFK
ncbi:hypothetical protein C0J52_25686 [Blattella germanica]|nr:hypothetical protein C0J52_25686 [Blattella germanica]